MDLIYPEPQGPGIAPFQPPKPPDDLELLGWDEYDTQFTVAAALKLNIPGVADFVSNGQGFIGMRSARNIGKVPRKGGGYDVFGISVSLLVHAIGADLTAETGVAVMSAQVQLKSASANSRFAVNGFHGNLWPMLVSQPSLDVEAFAKCVEALNAAKVYIGEHPEGQKPVFLGYEPPVDTSDAELRQAVVTAITLRSIAGGDRLRDSLNRLGEHTADDESTARSVWGRLMPSAGDDDEPNGVAIARARDAIKDLRL